MTTANKITIFRVILIPVFLVLMYLRFPGHAYWAFGVFVLASLSDFAAAWSGKVKTASTMVAICLMLLWDISWLNTVCWVVIVVTTVYSGVEYFVKNHDVFRKAA